MSGFFETIKRKPPSRAAKWVSLLCMAWCLYSGQIANQVLLTIGRVPHTIFLGACALATVRLFFRLVSKHEGIPDWEEVEVADVPSAQIAAREMLEAVREDPRHGR